MTFDNPAFIPARDAVERELIEYQESLEKVSQQTLLRGTATQLNITQEGLAHEMRVPWGTFRKWILPNESKDHRRMPDVCIRTLQLLLEIRELKQQVRNK